MKQNESSIIIVVTLILGILIFLVLFGDTLGFDSSLGNDLVMVAPGIMLTVLGLYFTTVMRGLYIIPGSGVVGIALAYLLGQLETQGYTTSNLLQSLTVTQAQLLLVVAGFVIGGFVVAITER